MSTVTHFNPDSIYGFDSASTGSVLTKGSSSSITFQNISAIVPSNVSYFTNDAGYINSAVTQMANYATSGDVVNSLNIVNNELPMSVYLFVNSSSGTAESYRDINGSEPISVREIVEYLNSGRTIEFYSKPLGWDGGQTPHTRLDNVMFGIGYNTPYSGRTYRIYGEAFNYANNKQYNFEAIDSTQNANPNYTWSATTTTSKSDYATKTYVDNAVSNIDDTIYIDGSGNTFTVYKSDDELYNLIVSDVRPNAVLMYNTDDSNTPIPMLCYFYNRQITNSGDSVYLRLHFVSSIEYGDIDLLFKRYTAMVVINMQKTYVDNVFHGYAINVYGSASFGHISISVPIPLAEQAGQLLSVSSAGTYELISIVNSENIPY